MGERGFTLVELMIIVALIGIIVAVVMGIKQRGETPKLKCVWEAERRLCLCMVHGSNHWQTAPDHACDGEDGR